MPKSNITIPRESEKTVVYIRQNPYNLMLALAMMGSVIMFFILSLAFFLRLNGSDWKGFQMPIYFWLSTGVIVLSSISMHQALNYFKKEEFAKQKNSLAFTLVMGFVFLVLQFFGWMHLFKGGVHWSSINGAFLYLLSGLHAIHLVLGLFWLGNIYRYIIKKSTYIDNYLDSLNPYSSIRLKLVAYYWHFMDLLWLYLFGLFVLYN